MVKIFNTNKCIYLFLIDYGMDNFTDVMSVKTDDHCIFLRWMNNWEYSDKVLSSLYTHKYIYLYKYIY